jgi:ribosome-binding protein aMBF1 (putative translation factor)
MPDLDRILVDGQALLSQADWQAQRCQTRILALREIDRRIAKIPKTRDSVEEFKYRMEQRGSENVQLMEIRSEVEELLTRVHNFLGSVVYPLAPDGKDVHDELKRRLENLPWEEEHYPEFILLKLAEIRSALVQVGDLCRQPSAEPSASTAPPSTDESQSERAEATPALLDYARSRTDAAIRREFAKRVQAAIDQNDHNQKEAAGHMRIDLKTLKKLLDGRPMGQKTWKAAERYIRVKRFRRLNRVGANPKTRKKIVLRIFPPVLPIFPAQSTSEPEYPSRER